MRPLLGQVRLACHDRHTTCCPTLNIETTLPAQRPHPPHGRCRHALRRRFSSPAVEQPAESELLIPLPPAPHMPVADAQDFGRLPPADLLRHRQQHHFLYLHRPLHGGSCVGVHACHRPTTSRRFTNLFLRQRGKFPPQYSGWLSWASTPTTPTPPQRLLRTAACSQPWKKSA